jgi:formate-nitrite transporter family protein
MSEALVDAFHRSVDEGRARLERSTPGLLATGVVGGIDVSFGLLALYVVEHATHDKLLGALAFGIGFVALTLANSELFTENFLVPVSTVAAAKAPWTSHVRLWVGTLAANLLGGWIAAALIVVGFAELLPTIRAIGSHPAAAGLDAASFASAVLAGVVITLMTWMEHSTESMPARLVAALVAAFVLGATPLLHAVVVSLEMFAALIAGASFGYLDWLGTLGWAISGNVAGGLLLVTTLRLVQVGKRELQKERARPPDAPRQGEERQP